MKIVTDELIDYVAEKYLESGKSIPFHLYLEQWLSDRSY